MRESYNYFSNTGYGSVALVSDLRKKIKEIEHNRN